MTEHWRHLERKSLLATGSELKLAEILLAF